MMILLKLVVEEQPIKVSNKPLNRRIHHKNCMYVICLFLPFLSMKIVFISGARHGHKMSAKQLRLEAAEAAFIASMQQKETDKQKKV